VHCVHDPMAIQLVRAGFFPAAPIFPQFAYSIELLEYYNDSAEFCANSAEAIAASLVRLHQRRGQLLFADDKVLHEGYRRTLELAMNWHELLRHQLERESVELIETLRASIGVDASDEQPPPASRIAPTTTDGGSTSIQGISERLKSLCPCCFEESRVGRTIEE
jgi:hypothetical protein